jgi:hypothetical protein
VPVCVPRRYATEIDVDFVRKSVRAIGICAVKIERAADRCIDVLLELIQTKVAYVVQEAVVVIKVRRGSPHAPHSRGDFVCACVRASVCVYACVCVCLCMRHVYAHRCVSIHACVCACV